MEQYTNVACGYTTSISCFKGGNEDGQHFALGTLILNWLLRKGRLRNYVGLSSYFFLRGLGATVWFRKRASAPSPQLQTVTLLARAC